METTAVGINGLFSDLTLVCKGDKGMTMGEGIVETVPAQSVEEWEEKAAAIRAIYATTLGRSPELNAKPDIKIEWEKQLEDYKRVEISFNSSYGERLEGTFLIPNGMKSPRPGVLALQQTTTFGRESPLGNDTSKNGHTLAYGKELALLGYPVFSYDLMSSHSRCGKGLMNFDTKEFYDRYPNWSATGCDIADVSRAIDVMQSFPEWIIPDRIASIGHSQGAGITHSAMVLEPRIKVGVINCGVWPEELEFNRWHICRTSWWSGRPFLQPYCIAGKPFPTSLHEELASVAPRASLVINAMNDYMRSSEAEMSEAEAGFNAMDNEIKKVYALYGCPERFRVITHRLGHSFLPEFHEIAYNFIKEFL